MNVVDSSGWLEYLADGPNAPFFAPAVEDAARLVVPAISLYEVFRHVLVRSGEGKALQAIAFLHRGRILPLYGDLALEAARLGVEHRLPLADATMLASARSAGAVLWTQDSDFEGIAGVRFPATRRG